MRKLHNLKIDLVYAEEILDGLKTYEIRLDDRQYAEGDLICFMVNCKTEIYHIMQNKIYKIISLTDYAQKEGWVVFGIKELK